ncbi:hypothetical protein F66182_8522 [Fusarium sp. NRRL 66182]|nr:hypothetical protein F66182_8522 [Fusarium sp. NRRL 66182]
MLDTKRRTKTPERLSSRSWSFRSKTSSPRMRDDAEGSRQVSTELTCLPSQLPSSRPILPDPTDFSKRLALFVSQQSNPQRYATPQYASPSPAPSNVTAPCPTPHPSSKAASFVSSTRATSKGVSIPPKPLYVRPVSQPISMPSLASSASSHSGEPVALTALRPGSKSLTQQREATRQNLIDLTGAASAHSVSQPISAQHIMRQLTSLTLGFKDITLKHPSWFESALSYPRDDLRGQANKGMVVIPIFKNHWALVVIYVVPANHDLNHVETNFMSIHNPVPTDEHRD